MIRANYTDKERIIDILANSFQDNKSVNYIIKQDNKRIDRIRHLMDYSFEICYMFGDVLLSDDKAACALIVLPDKKKTNLKSVLLDIRLIFSCMGLSNVKKAMARESKIKKFHPKVLMYYLWFIGVDPKEQNKGIGSMLLNDVLKQASLKNRFVYLETSTLKNIPWYEKFGFKIYTELDLGYRLYFLKNE
ncbi:MAG: GNAT family N-acetyltransferase [Ginsengibacter sp.]